MQDNIFFATDRKIGIFGARNFLVFIQTPAPRIFCRNNRLFVFLTNCLGVVEIVNAGELKKNL